MTRVTSGPTRHIDANTRIDHSAEERGAEVPGGALDPPANSGLDRATDAGPTPIADGAPPVSADGVRPAPAGLSHVAARLAARGQTPGLLDLVPGRYPGTVGLADVLRAAADDPQTAGAVQGIITELEQTTGIKVPAQLVAAALADPAKLVDVLQVSPAEMSAGMDAMNATHSARADDTSADPGRARVLPRRFSFADLARTDIARPEAKLEELAPGLLRGDIKSELSDDAAKARIATAEVMDRLADNANLPADQRFQARYGDGTFTRLDTFLQALVEDGHQIEVEVGHRVANFASLMTRAPNGALLDVPAPLMVRTGFKNDAGEEAVLPAVHSELVITIKPGPDTRGPGVDAKVKWYQGVPHTGFFAEGLNRSPAWLGGQVADRFTGDQALEAAELAGLLSDVINDTAKEQGLAMSGYGVTGVCNDSVAIIQHALAGEATGYPLMMRDGAVTGELFRRLDDADHRDDPEYRRLRESIEAVPSDVAPNASSRARALASVPWEPGQEPLQSTVAAREILEN